MVAEAGERGGAVACRLPELSHPTPPRQSRRFPRDRLHQAHAHIHLQIAADEALKNAFGGRYILVVTSHGDGDVVVAGQGLVSGIEPHPTEAGQAAFHPGMSGVCSLRRGLHR